MTKGVGLFFVYNTGYICSRQTGSERDEIRRSQPLKWIPKFYANLSPYTDIEVSISGIPEKSYPRVEHLEKVALIKKDFVFLR